ncbi:MAG: synthase subunit delta [Homoserinimonas sp.]|jgi:F-type H+-transporting ATPase subunit delta|nr:synthase subunit delta [Homoserinimonas sp.]
MGATTRESLATSKAALATLGEVSLEMAEELFAAGRIIGESAQLRSLLSEPAGDGANKVAILTAVFGSKLSEQVLGLLAVVVAGRWSKDNDLLAGIEELGLRAAASSVTGSSVDVEGELYAFGKAVSSNAQLELAISSKLGTGTSKVALVDALLIGKVSPQTLAIVRHLVQQPRGRRINGLVSGAASVVADQAGYVIATISSAKPLAPAQLLRLKTGLAGSYGRQVKVNEVIDSALIGGVRVQIGDDIIDGSVATRLNELRLQLAG